MSKYTKQVIISYDSDAAGQRAADKAIKLLGETGLDVRVLRIPGAKDPDEFFKKNGRTGHEKFKLLLDGSRSQFDFKLDGVLSRYDISDVDQRVKAASELCRIISRGKHGSRGATYTSRSSPTGSRFRATRLKTTSHGSQNAVSRTKNPRRCRR